jgi:two-component system KDP operon response regulator KdpE
MVPTNNARVLVVEDESQIRNFIRALLLSHDYRCFEATTAEEAIREAAMQRPDAILVDLMLPDGSGLEVVQRIREWTTTPIIVLSARNQEADKIAALDAGADDYLTKPFSTGELLARLRAALRRAAVGAAGEEPSFEFGDLHVDLATRRVRVRGDEIQLTPTEYRLLTLLVRHAGRVLTHRQLLKEVWGPRFTAQTHYLRVYMAQLRQKIEQEPARPKLLVTESGVGYRLRID